jgi:predicted MFS family arabinose efflux permease
MAQSGAFVGMLARVQRAEVPLVGTMWNMAFDGGVSLGGAVLGLVVALSGTPTAVLWSLPLLSVLALLLFATDRGELRTG